VLGFVEVAQCEGNYQSTRDGKTLVWNSTPKPGDVATWSGDRDREDYAHGFGRLVWYTREPESAEPQLYARYWGRMVAGKFEGPVNVHAKGKTHHAIFINGTRMTRWTLGTATMRVNSQWQRLVAKGNQKLEFAANAQLRSSDPEAPAAGPADEPAGGNATPGESIQDLYNERWPKIEIDESLRLLAFPPRTLRR
jgi:hypothetical protein